MRWRCASANARATTRCRSGRIHQQRIRELAVESKVPVVENPPLARALYAAVDVDGEIPAEHYKAVAQIIGFIMRQRSRS